jgi:SAM-dependent methyltransferase
MRSGGNNLGVLAMQPDEMQRQHYDKIAAQYEAHYDDAASQQYRRRFIDRPLLDGLDLEARHALEAMCGSGQTTGSLLSRGARVTGLDISDAAIESFRRRWPTCAAVRASLLESGLPSESFDVVVVVAGLHHIQPNVEVAIDEIHRLLKVGGTFCFMEPHAGSVPDWFRRRWYKRDPLFMPDEAAIDVGQLKTRYAGRFDFLKEVYGGNVAFLLVLNSLVFRIPLAWKRVYAPALLRLEGMIGAWQGKSLSCFALCQWRKK